MVLYLFRGLILFFSLFLAACSITTSREITDSVTTLAADNGMRKEVLATSNFSLYSLHKVSTDSHIATVYIEGDGFAWANRYRVSSNPTPRSNTVVRLAFKDPAANVFYLARPCQYIDLQTQPLCARKYWTSHRFAPQVITTYKQALDTIRREYGIQTFNLIGYSGGGAIATILAAERDDVKSLITVAGNLDHISLNQAHKVSPIPESLNAIDYAHKLKDIPQIHYSGSEDTIVLPWITKKFVDAVNNPQCVKLRSIQGATHNKGWISIWRDLGKIQPVCK